MDKKMAACAAPPGSWCNGTQHIVAAAARSLAHPQPPVFAHRVLKDAPSLPHEQRALAAPVHHGGCCCDICTSHCASSAVYNCDTCTGAATHQCALCYYRALNHSHHHDTCYDPPHSPPMPPAPPSPPRPPPSPPAPPRPPPSSPSPPSTPTPSSPPPSPPSRPPSDPPSLPLPPCVSSSSSWQGAVRRRASPVATDSSFLSDPSGCSHGDPIPPEGLDGDTHGDQANAARSPSLVTGAGMTAALFLLLGAGFSLQLIRRRRQQLLRQATWTTVFSQVNAAAAGGAAAGVVEGY